MEKLFFTFYLLFVAFFSYSQDVIVKKNGDNLKVIVTEISATSLLYKSFDNQQGSTLSISKSDVFVVVFKSGLKVKYKGNLEDISTIAVSSQDKIIANIEPDIIVLKTGQEIKGVVRSIEDTKTLYQRSDFPLLPVHSIPKSDILEIKYSKKILIQENQSKPELLPKVGVGQENKTSIIPKTNAFTSTLEYKKRAFWQNGQVLTLNQSEEILKTNQRAFDFYSQGKKNVTTFNVLRVFGLVAVGSYFLVPKNMYGLQGASLGVGLAASIGGFVVQSNVKNKFIQAVSAYNSGNSTTFSHPKTYYGITENGQIAIGLKF